jgi:hypothetical protein
VKRNEQIHRRREPYLGCCRVACRFEQVDAIDCCFEDFDIDITSVDSSVARESSGWPVVLLLIIAPRPTKETVITATI